MSKNSSGRERRRGRDHSEQPARQASDGLGEMLGRRATATAFVLVLSGSNCAVVDVDARGRQKNVFDLRSAQKELRKKGFVRYPALLGPEELDAYREPVIDAAMAIARRCSQCSANDRQDLHNKECRGCERPEASGRKSFIKSKNVHRADEQAKNRSEHCLLQIRSVPKARL